MSFHFLKTHFQGYFDIIINLFDFLKFVFLSGHCDHDNMNWMVLYPKILIFNFLCNGSYFNTYLSWVKDRLSLFHIRDLTYLYLYVYVISVYLCIYTNFFMYPFTQLLLSGVFICVWVHRTFVCYVWDIHTGMPMC